MLILASNSPRRKQLLAAGGWEFQVLSAEVDETPLEGEAPEQYVLRLAEAKARQTARLLAINTSPGTVILAADTTVIESGRILGKPADLGQAGEMLERLRDRTHQVASGLAVLRPEDPAALVNDVCITQVAMRRYSEAEMTAYLATGDPLDKAGAYAIQHPVFQPVQAITGCYANVMGLPVCRVRRLLEQFGLTPSQDLYRACESPQTGPCLIVQRALHA